MSSRSGLPGTRARWLPFMSAVWRSREHAEDHAPQDHAAQAPRSVWGVEAEFEATEGGYNVKNSRSTRSSLGALLVLLVVTASLFVAGGTAVAAPTPVGLGTATDNAIRAGSGVTNTGALTTITGDLGNSPGAGTQITGLTCVPPQVIGVITQASDGGPTPCSVTNATLATTVE